MNGGRLSNDEACLLGISDLRAQLAASVPDPDAAQRALARIAMRFPDQAEQLTGLYESGQWPGCQALLDEVERDQRSELEDS